MPRLVSLPAVAAPPPPAVPAPDILRRMGFVAMEPIEHALLAGLVTGDPVLLVGELGSAKSALVGRLAGALELRFWSYDASKALFEDLGGYPNPFALRHGRIEYAPTPISIWDKELVLIDEISRAAPSMQNKWLEVIRQRQLMGLRITGLRHVFAAMNPPGYLGATPLDAALLGRFAWVLRVPDARDMDGDQLRQIAATVTSDDAPLAAGALGRVPSSAAAAEARLRRLVARARKRLAAVARREGEPATRYAAELAIHLRAAGVDLDGRRLGMVRRNLLASLALLDTLAPRRAPAAGSDAHERHIEAMALQSLPFAALEEPPAPATFAAAHVAAYGLAWGGRAAAGADAVAVLGARDPAVLVARYEKVHLGLSGPDHHEALTRVLDALEATPAAGRAPHLAALLRMAAALAANPTAPVEVVSRALGAVRERCGYDDVRVDDVQTVLEEMEPPALDDPLESLALRAGIRWARERRPGWRGAGMGRSVDEAEARQIHQGLVRDLRHLRGERARLARKGA